MERLQEIKKCIEYGDKPSWSDIAWMILTIEEQQKELDDWREEFMF